MADVTELRCWPACVDAIDWSSEGIIALASDERVELLFPNTIAFDRDQDGAQWQHVPLQAPWFTDEELPLKEPAPLESYSIGQEISASAPIAISWSSSGLAKHRRSALATLTGNLVLSIWSADGRLQERSSWRRRIILNKTLSDYFRQESQVGQDAIEQARRQCRVRAFAWAPPFSHDSRAHMMGSRFCQDQHVVAICTDNNELVLVTIKSPTTTYGKQQNWTAEAVAHTSLSSRHENVPKEAMILEGLLSQQRYISHVSWSPWKILNGRYKSLLVYATNDEIRGRVVTYASSNFSLGDEIVYVHGCIRFNGLLKWCHIIEDCGTFTLALFMQDRGICLDISVKDGSLIRRREHDLDGRWDQISGLVWDTAKGCTSRMHFSSLLSTIDNPTCVLELDSDELKPGQTSNWREQIHNSTVLFSVKNDLNGHSKVKVWGLSASPIGNFIASCTSNHPSDMIEYGAPNDRRGTVSVSAIRSYHQIRQSFPAIDVSAEGILFTLKKLVENTIEETSQLPDFATEMVEKLLQAYSAPITSIENDQQHDLQTNQDASLITFVENFKRSAYFDVNSLKDRYTILVSHACEGKASNDLPKTLIAYRLAAKLGNPPRDLVPSAFSAEISKHHRRLVSLVQKLTSTAEDSEDPVTVSADAHMDRCEFCNAAIPFTDLTTATCLNGHQFPRCGLSFIAIQAPGITKYCGICSTPFFSEELVAAQERGHMMVNSEVQENGMTDQKMTNGELSETGGDRRSVEEKGGIRPTLAQLLFFACDACIYCGGKFIG